MVVTPVAVRPETVTSVTSLVRTVGAAVGPHLVLDTLQVLSVMEVAEPTSTLHGLLVTEAVLSGRRTEDVRVPLTLRGVPPLRSRPDEPRPIHVQTLTRL